MIFFFKNGRLGNQLFQYAGLKFFFPDQKLVFFGCDDLIDVLSECSIISFSFQKISKHISPNLLEKFFNFFVKIRFIGLIWEKRDKNNFYVVKKRGLIPNCFLLKDSFFQHKVVLDRLKNDFRIKSTHLMRAMKWLELNKLDFNTNNLVFVHIRRGDYLFWPNPKSPAILPSIWYIKAMLRIKGQIKSPKFIILTDDIFYVNDLFGHKKDIFISTNNLLVDLALMSLCTHGILSPSSFSWWGAWFSFNRNASQNKVFIAPKYWGGHRSRKWEPEGFISDWIEYIE